MNLYVLFQVCGELFLYYALLSGIPGLFPYTFSPVWPILISGASAAIAAYLSDHGKFTVRYLCLLFPLCCLTFGQTVMDFLVLIPPVIYVAVTIFRDEWDLEYFHFREFFRKSLIVLGIFLLIIFFGAMLEDTTRQRNPLLDANGTLRYGLIYAVLGIILQRQLRMGTDSRRSKYVSNLQLTLVTLSSGLLILAILGTERYLASQGISLGALIGEALRFVVGLPVYLLGILVTWIMGLNTDVLEEIQEAQPVETQPMATNPLPELGEAVIPQQQEIVVSFPWWLAVLILTLLTVGLILLTRMLRNRPSGSPIRETVEKLSPQTRPPRADRRSNRQKVRKLYRDYLKSEQSHGHKLTTWQTSQDILHGMRPGADRRAAASLRKIYLSARYDPDAKISPNQVQSAKEQLKKIQ